MATRSWIGSAPSIAQVTQWTFGGTWLATETVTVTIGTRSWTVLTGSTVIATLLANIVAAYNLLTAANYPEFKDVTAAVSGTTIFQATSNTAGLQFTLALSTNSASGTIGAPSNTVVNSSPNDWSIAANWAENAVPVAADDVVIDRGSVDILYGLAQSGVTLTSLTIRAAYIGNIGLPTRNASGYEEYRATQLAISATTCTIGQGDGTGSGRIKLNFGSVQTALTVFGMGTSIERGLAALLWKGTHASNVVNIYSGTFGVAVFSGETAVIATLRQTGGSIVTSTGTTLTTIDKNGGTLETFSGATTVTNRGGGITLWAGAFTTINILQDTINYNSTGTITNLNVYDGGVADFDTVNQARTVTNCTIVSGSKITDKAKTVTWTNGIILTKCGNEAVTLVLGEDITLTRS